MSNKISALKGIISPLDNSTVNLPQKFLCPLSQELMTEPVWISGSKIPITYDHKNLEDFFETNGYIDPQTKQDLGKDIKILPNKALQREIEDFLESKQPKKSILSF